MELISKILPGLGEMANIHPMLVHFPIALLNAFILMELLAYLLKKEELRSAATWMLYLGTLGALGAVGAGFVAAGSVPHDSEIHTIMTRHRNFGVTVLCLSLILSIFRFIAIDKARTVQFLIGIITVVTMTFGADLGGLMVYKYGVAVQAVPRHEEHDHSASGKNHSVVESKDDDEFSGIILEDDSMDTAKDHDDHSVPHEH